MGSDTGPYAYKSPDVCAVVLSFNLCRRLLSSEMTSLRDVWPDPIDLSLTPPLLEVRTQYSFHTSAGNDHHGAYAIECCTRIPVLSKDQYPTTSRTFKNVPPKSLSSHCYVLSR